MRRDRENEAGVGVRLRPSAEAETITDATPADSGALLWEAGSAYQVLNVATMKHRFVRSAALNEPEDLHELETSCALSGEVATLLADPPVHHSQCAGSGRLRS